MTFYQNTNTLKTAETRAPYESEVNVAARQIQDGGEWDVT